MNTRTFANKLMQLEMHRLGTYLGEIDGIYGPKTQLAYDRMINLDLQKKESGLDWDCETIDDFIKEPSWLKIAWKEMLSDVMEIPGKKADQRILEYHESVKLKTSSDEIPWCSSFVNWCFQQVGKQGANNAAARSWLTWGRFLEKPCFGSVVVLSRGSSVRQGHIGFYVGKKDYNIFLLGGNQNDSVNISEYPKTRLLGVVWPFDVPVKAYY